MCACSARVGYLSARFFLPFFLVSKLHCWTEDCCIPIVKSTGVGERRKRKNSRIIPTHGLQLARLICRNLLRGRAFLVEGVVEPDADGDGIADVRYQIWPRDAEADGCVVDVVDEVVHVGGGEVHEAVDLRSCVQYLCIPSQMPKGWEGEGGKGLTCACEGEPVYFGNSGDEQPRMMPKYS